MTLNLFKLSNELRAAGLPGNCSSDGRVDFADGTSYRPGQPVTNAQEKIAAAVLAAHDSMPLYTELRAKEYPTTDALVIALWEKLIEGRPAASDALQAQRAAIKLKYPKPGAV